LIAANRKLNDEGRAFPGFSLEPNFPAMLLKNDGTRQRESLAGPFAYILGCKEWFKYFRAMFRIDAGSRIANSNFDAIVNCRSRNPYSAFLIRYGHLVCDGVRRVDNEVKKNLVNLARQTPHQGKRWFQYRLNFGHVF